MRVGAKSSHHRILSSPLSIASDASTVRDSSMRPQGGLIMGLVTSLITTIMPAHNVAHHFTHLIRRLTIRPGSASKESLVE